MATYVVKAGDTLGAIAARLYGDWRLFGVIAAANDLADPNLLRIGQRLRIPAEPSTSTSADTTRPAAPALAVNDTSYRLRGEDYLDDLYRKDLVVLHFTAGTTVSGAYQTFRKWDAEVSTPFVVDRKGRIFQLYDPKYWSYHLGIKKRHDPNHYNDKRSVAIEVVNVGPLKEARDNKDVLNWWPSDYGTKWCTKQDTDLFIEAADRGVEYYASFTEEQYSAVAALVAHLCAEFGVPRDVPDDKRKADARKYRDFKGVLSHQHFRTDKYDMGPAFDWELFLGRL